MKTPPLLLAILFVILFALLGMGTTKADDLKEYREWQERNSHTPGNRGAMEPSKYYHKYYKPVVDKVYIYIPKHCLDEISSSTIPVFGCD